MENSFLFGSGALLLFAYYSQYQEIFKYHKHPLNGFVGCLNRDMLEAQIVGVTDDLMNRFYFWKYTWSFILITIIAYFTFPIDKLYFVIGTSVFLFIQFAIEYLGFTLEVASDAQDNNISVDEALSKKEVIVNYKKVDLSNDVKFDLSVLTTVLEDDISEDALKSQIKDLLSFSEFFKDGKNIEILVDKKNVVIYIDLFNSLFDDFKSYQITITKDEALLKEAYESNSSFFSSFYEYVSFEKLFVRGLLEPIIGVAIIATIFI